MAASSKNHGFSLVEVAIVLGILGLLIGGVLTGQYLIRAAELRSVTTEFSKYEAAILSFKEKYNAIPGDMANATRYWGRADTGATDGSQCASPISDTGTGTRTCNGDGNGYIAPIGGQAIETFRFWQHLSNAGFIEGSYTGITEKPGTKLHLPDVNTPASKTGGDAGWSVDSEGPDYVGWSPAPYGWWPIKGIEHKNMTLGAPISSDDDEPIGPAFSPDEVWNIDTKMDDGAPGRGNVMVIHWQECTDAAAGTDYATATYDIGNKTIACAINFLNVY